MTSIYPTLGEGTLELKEGDGIETSSWGSFSYNESYDITKRNHFKKKKGGLECREHTILLNDKRKRRRIRGREGFVR